MKPLSTRAEAETALPNARLAWWNQSASNESAAAPEAKKAKHSATVCVMRPSAIGAAYLKPPRRWVSEEDCAASSAASREIAGS